MIISLLILPLSPFLLHDSLKCVLNPDGKLDSKTVIWTDASGDVTDFLGSPASHNPVDITTIDENGSMSLLNVTFTGIPASGTTPGWTYVYETVIDKDHDNTTNEYVVMYQFQVSVGISSCYIQRESDHQYWNGTAWRSSPQFDNSYAHINGYNMIFNFSGCPDLIGDNWYNMMAFFTDGMGSGYADMAMGSITSGPMFFAGKSTGKDRLAPTVKDPGVVPSVGLSGTIFRIQANVTDMTNVNTVIACIQYPDETNIQNITLFDDGTHNDGAFNDTLYANVWNSTGRVNGTYYIDIWVNDTLGNANKIDNAKFFIIGRVPETCLFDGMYYNWTGIYNLVIYTPWNGTENYDFIEGNIYYDNHYDSRFGHGDWFTDNATRILTATPTGIWGSNVHDPIFIPKNVTLNDQVLVSTIGTDRTFNVSSITYLDILNTTLECWKLTELSGYSVLYYETSSGLLMQGTFNISMGYYYTIVVDATNVPLRSIPYFTIQSPKNQTYHYNTIPIIIINSTPIEKAWYRNSTNGITWSNNYTLNYNTTHFINYFPIWHDGPNIIQIFANNSQGKIFSKSESFTVDTYGPWIELNSPENRTYLYRTIPIIVSKYTSVDYIAFRYTTGTGWTSNKTLFWNGTHYIDDTIPWLDGTYHLQVFANDSTSEMAIQEVRYRIMATYPLNISNNLGDNMLPKVVVTQPGKVYIFWAGDATGWGHIYSDNNLNGHFGNQVDLTSFLNGEDAIQDAAVDPSGNIHLIWVRQNFLIEELQLVYSNNTGGNFHSGTVVNSPSPYNLFPTIAVDSKNIVHLAWIGLNITKFGWNIFYTNNTGGSFNPPHQITPGIYDITGYMAMAIDKRDILHLAYVYDVHGNSEIMYQTISNGIASTPVNVSKRLGSDITPSIAVNSTGTVHIAWRGQGSSPYESEIFYSNNSRGTFSTPLNISKNLKVNDVHPCIKLDETRQPNIVFISWSFNATPAWAGSRMQIVLINNTYGSFGAKIKITPLQIFVNASNFAIDPVNQQIHIVWMANIYPTNIYYTYLNYSYPKPLELLTPQNKSYNTHYLPIIIKNNTIVQSVWYRRNTGMGWSSNTTLIFNGSRYINASTILWNDGFYHIQIFSNSPLGPEFLIDRWLTVDTQYPSASQWANLTSNFIQTNQVIWIRGTAFDPPPSSGLLNSNIFISASNTSASWSNNIGSATNWAFYNLTSVKENAPNAFYRINVTIKDQAGNKFILICNISVDATPPHGSQFLNTSRPQNAINKFIWINGSAADYGSGLKSVTITSHNVTGGTSWTLNIGTNSSWAFTNTSAILDTPANSKYEIVIQITDKAGNSYQLPCYIIVDIKPPSGTQNSQSRSPQKGDWNHCIWINGTALDSGSGLKSIRIVSDNVTGGTTWSINLGSLSNWAFRNTSRLLDTPANTIYAILLNITDSADNSIIYICYIFVDVTPPSGSQALSTYYNNIQPLDNAGRIWVNGSAWDLGSGLQNLIIQFTNITGGINWSTNVGSISSWAFFNTTPLPQLNAGEKFLIQLKLTDRANNSYILNCYISYDFQGPTLTQSFSTRIPQTGILVWINGTALDSMLKVQNVSIISSNLTIFVSWSLNQGTNETWSFTNASAIPDGHWTIVIQGMDTLLNKGIFSGRITVDNTPPLISNLSSTVAESNVTLTWLPAFDLTNVLYLVYQNDINIANTTSLYLLLFNLPKGEYHFSIKAIDSLGHLSESSRVITVQITPTSPSNQLWIIIIITIGAAIGVVAGIFSYRKGVGTYKPKIIPKEKTTWIAKAIGYSPEFEQKIAALLTKPQKITQIEDAELTQFLKNRFTFLSSDLLSQLDKLPLSEAEKIEILNTLLILPPERRIKVLQDILEDQQEVPS